MADAQLPISSDCFVSVIAPLYDDADIVESFVEEVADILDRSFANWELVLIDDGSIDETVDRVTEMLSKRECIRMIRLSRTFGYEIAISAGLDAVIGDFVVVMRPDSDPPALIPRMVERCRAGAGTVYGIRKNRKGEPISFRLGVRAFYWYVNRILGLDLPPNSTDFRAFTRQSVNAIVKIKDRRRYLRTFSSYVGFQSESFEYEPVLRRPQPRVRGFFEALNQAISMVVANSTSPLRMVTWLGLLISGLNAFYAIYVVFVYFFFSNVVAGWATRSLQTSTMFFFLFLIIAVLCEYVGRLLSETSDRPLYYVLEERTSSVLIADAERKNVVTESLDRAIGDG